MAAGFLVAEARRRQLDGLQVASVGLRGNGEPTDPHVVDILSTHGIDMSRKRSRSISPAAAVSSDLILTMTTHHTRHVVSLIPDVAGRTFAMRDFVHVVRRRSSTEPFGDWVAQASVNGATHARYLVDGSNLDIADPIGQPRSSFERMADEMIEMVAWIVRCTGMFELESHAEVPTGYRYRKVAGRRRRSPSAARNAGPDSTCSAPSPRQVNPER